MRNLSKHTDSRKKMVAIADCIRNERNTESLRVVNSDV